MPADLSEGGPWAALRYCVGLLTLPLVSAYFAVLGSGFDPNEATSKALKREITLALEWGSGAGDETRTRDIQLGRLPLC